MCDRTTTSQPIAQSRLRRSTLRLRGFDYSTPGGYFVTICTFRKACLFGQVVEDRMSLSATGSLVASMWAELPHRYPAVQIDTFVVMPNHIHGILILTHEHLDVPPPKDGRAWEPAPTVGLPDIVHRFKSLTTREFAPLQHDRVRGPIRRHLWQRNYYEHVIRDDAALLRIREYITNNPLAWALDRENPCAERSYHPSGPTEPWEV